MSTNKNKKAIKIYEKYNKCNEITNLLYIKACTNICEYNKVKKLINNLDTLTDYNIEFINVLIHFYSKIGDITNALNIFN